MCRYNQNFWYEEEMARNERNEMRTSNAKWENVNTLSIYLWTQFDLWSVNSTKLLAKAHDKYWNRKFSNSFLLLFVWPFISIESLFAVDIRLFIYYSMRSHEFNEYISSPKIKTKQTNTETTARKR